TDVGVEERRRADITRAHAQLGCGGVDDFCPSLHGDALASCIHRDDDSIGKRAAHFTEEASVERGPRANDCPARPGLDRGFHGGQITQATADLDRDWSDRSHHGRDKPGLAGRAERAVEVDHVQALGAETGPAHRHGYRIIGEHRGLVSAALAQTNTPAVLDVDSRDDGHARAVVAARTSAAKFSRRRRPQRWLFSGWNWVAKMTPRSMAAAKRTP